MLIVQCDFDSTITMGNINTGIKEAFGADNWLEIEAEYDSKQTTAEQNTIHQYGLINASEDEIREFVKGDVVVRFSFDEFVGHCDGEGIRLVIVSTGIKTYIDVILDMLDLTHIEVHAGSADFTEAGINVTYNDPYGNMLGSGLKESWTTHFKDEGHTVIYIGDGPSDEDSAQKADYVIARAELADIMDQRNLPFHRFDNFEDVGERVEEIRQELKEATKPE